MKAFVIGIGVSLGLAGMAWAQPGPPPGPGGAPGMMAPPTEGEVKLAECVSTKASAEDKATLAKWIAAEIAASPLLEGVATVDSEKRVALDKATAQIFTRLVVSDCADVSKPLFKAEGRTAFRAAGAAVSRLGIRELISAPGMNQAIVRSYITNLNQADFAKLIQP